MPYTITTEDGLTLPNVPDNIAPDAPQIKARIQQMRAERQGQPAGPVGQAEAGGVAGGLKMGLRDPVDAGAQMLRRVIPEPVARAVDAAGNWLANQGLPVARSDGVAGVDKIVRDVGQQYEADRAAAGRDGFDAARLVGGVVNPVNLALPSATGARTAMQLARTGAVAGGAGAALQPVTGDGDFWSEKGKQAAGGAVAGGVMTPVLSKAATAAATAAKNFRASRAPAAVVMGGTPGLSRADLDQAVGQVLQSQGMRVEDAPRVILDSVRRQIAEATAGRLRLSPEQALRLAEAEAIGLTGDAGLTAGQLTRQPLQWAREKNLSGVMIDTPAGPRNPLADRFAAQNRALQGVFDNLGANRAADNVVTGELGVSALNEGNQRADDAVRAAYDAFERATGKRLEIPLQGLAQDYAEALRRYGDNIPGAVRAAMDRLGLMDGRQRAVLTIEGAEDLIKNVINRNDPGPMNRPVHGALGELRAAVQNAVASGADNATSGAGAEAAMLAREARNIASGVYQTRREIPALAAAAADIAPDRFVQQFILSPARPFREVAGMADVLRQKPQAWQAVRASVAQHLKQAAFGTNAAGDKTIAPERFAQALQAIGPQKLQVLFSPDEVVRLNIAARRAAEMESVPAGAKMATNFSGSGNAIFNLLQMLSGSPGLRQIPGVRSLANQAGEIVNERAIGQALQPATAATKPPTQLSPEAVRALQALFAPAALAGGAAAGSGY